MGVVIVDGCRTAIGKFGGSLKPVSAEDLAVTVMKASLERSGVKLIDIDEVIFGQCRQSSDASNIARTAALRAGVPETVPANTVMCACASGMLAINNGYNSILTGQNDTVLTGGTESMTNAIFYLSNARWGVGTGSTQLKDSLTEAQINSQPNDIYGSFNMGYTAENIAELMNISREDQDKFALDSQNKALKAIAEGRFMDEIVPVTIYDKKKKENIIFDTDEFPKETSMEKLAKLRAVFKEGGTVTAGTSSGRNDGAAALLLMSEEKARESGMKVMAKIKGIAAAATDPRYMGLGPVTAVKKVLKKTDLCIDDIELIELNEAFAAQSLGVIRQLGIEDKMDIINVNGGAIALGHPIGCSGARIVVTLIHEMEKRDLHLGLATLCVAGGMGYAMIVERN